MLATRPPIHSFNKRLSWANCLLGGAHSFLSYSENHVGSAMPSLRAVVQIEIIFVEFLAQCLAHVGVPQVPLSLPSCLSSHIDW